MKITTKYSICDLYSGKCKSCGEETGVLKEGGEERFVDMCPGCIEAIKFEEMTAS